MAMGNDNNVGGILQRTIAVLGSTRDQPKLNSVNKLLKWTRCDF
jgi:hypothetical protein